jgi:replicative DNA helicase
MDANERHRQGTMPADLEEGAEVVAAPVNLFQRYTLEDARRDAQAAGEGFPTGFAFLEENDFRWRPGKLYVVAGRPGDGKTCLLLELLMRNVEARANSPEDGRGPAVFVTYEESLRDVYLRLVLRKRGRAGDRLDDAKLHQRARWLALGDSDNAKLNRELAEAAAVVDDYTRRGLLVILDGDQDGHDAGQLLEGLEQSARTLGKAPSLVVVDYYQKVRPAEGLRAATRQEQLQDVADRLRRFSKGQPQAGGEMRAEFAVPVLVAAQVNRDALNGKDPHPELHNIREADDLANDAAGVLTLSRPTEASLKVKIVKNRDGKREATHELNFYGPSGCIEDASERALVPNLGDVNRGRA